MDYRPPIGGIAAPTSFSHLARGYQDESRKGDYEKQRGGDAVQLLAWRARIVTDIANQQGETEKHKRDVNAKHVQRRFA
jgi:hypothetical protein